jgi:hypothetical protein
VTTNHEIIVVIYDRAACDWSERIEAVRSALPPGRMATFIAMPENCILLAPKSKKRDPAPKRGKNQ